MAGKLGRALRAVRTALLTVGVVGLLFVLAASVVPGFLGYGAAVVTSGSMGDALPTGSVAFTRNAEVGEIAVGDIITFRHGSASQPTTHRVVATALEDGRRVLTTKGDANATDDATPVVASSGTLPRVVASLPLAGYVLDFARGPVGVFFFVILPVAGLLFDRQRSERSGRRKAASDTADSDPLADGPVFVDPRAAAPLFVDPVALELETPAAPVFADPAGIESFGPAATASAPEPAVTAAAPAPMPPAFDDPEPTPVDFAAPVPLGAPVPLDVPAEAVAAAPGRPQPAPAPPALPPVISLPATSSSPASLPSVVQMPMPQPPFPVAPAAQAAAPAGPAPAMPVAPPAPAPIPPPASPLPPADRWVTSLEPAAHPSVTSPPVPPPASEPPATVDPVRVAEAEFVRLDEPAPAMAATGPEPRKDPKRTADWSWDFDPEGGRRRGRRK